MVAKKKVAPKKVASKKVNKPMVEAKQCNCGGDCACHATPNEMAVRHLKQFRMFSLVLIVLLTILLVAFFVSRPTIQIFI